MSNESIGQPLPGNEGLEIKKGAIKFGIIGGLASIIVSLILFFANLQFEAWAKWLSSVVLIAAIILGIKAIADDNKNRSVSFGSLFGGGMLITSIITVFTVLYFLFYINLLQTDFIERILDISRQQMAQKGLGEEQIDKAIEMSKKFMSPGIMVAFSILGTMIIGAIISLIGAAIFKKEK